MNKILEVLPPEHITKAALDVEQWFAKQWVAQPTASRIPVWEFLGLCSRYHAHKVRQLEGELAAANARIARLEEALVEIESAMRQPASNRRFMQIAGPARQVINIVKKTKEAKPQVHEWTLNPEYEKATHSFLKPDYAPINVGPKPNP